MADAEPLRETLTVTALGHAGDGVAETTAGRIFVPFALPGETVVVAREGDRATLLAIVAPSPQRVVPPCRHFGICGGCSLQHLAPPAYLQWKREQVAAAFAQRGIDAAIAPIIAVPPQSRRRAVMTLERAGRGATLGFNRAGSHDVIDIPGCLVIVPAILRARPSLAALLAPLVPPGRRGRVTVVAADNGLDVAVDDLPPPDPKALARLVPSAAAEPSLARLTVLGEEVFHAREPTIALGAAALLPPAGGFLQAVAAAESALADAVMRGVGASRKIADLFCGAGTFSLRLAKQATVAAFDGDAASCTALERAVRRAAGLKRITVQRRDLFKNPVAGRELDGLDAVVFDPPRAGAKAQAEALAKSAVPRVVAVSCNPATLARDARILIDGGYRLAFLQPVDQFLWTAHVEAVAGFVR